MMLRTANRSGPTTRAGPRWERWREMGRASERAIWAGPGAFWRRTEVDGARFRWVEAGSGPPLLLLHGYGGSAHWWARNIEALGAVRRVYALDLPGFGRSQMAGR